MLIGRAGGQSGPGLCPQQDARMKQRTDGELSYFLTHREFLAHPCFVDASVLRIMPQKCKGRKKACCLLRKRMRWGCQ